MKKSYFFKIITLFATTIISSLQCMENGPSTSAEKPKLIIKLRLKEVGRKSIEFCDDCGFSEQDKNACTILGITWEENNNRYWVTKATVNNPNTQQKLSWLDECPVGLSQTSISHYFNEDIDQCEIIFPSSLPAHFVAQLKQKNITLKNDLSAEITLKLGYIKEKKIKSNSSYTFTFFTGITITGIIAWLIYLHRNNQLNIQLSHINDFIKNLVSSKNS